MSQTNFHGSTAVDFNVEPNLLPKTCDLDVSSKKTDQGSPNIVHSSIVADAVRSKLLRKPSVPFWSDNPNILFQQPYLFELFPTETMTYNQKLNAITRLVILLTAIGYIFKQNARILAVSAMTILAIFLLHFAHMNEITKPQLDKAEGFQTTANILPVDIASNGIFIPDKNVLPQGNYNPAAPVRTDFIAPSAINPLNNVMLTDYEFNPNKQPAPPAFTKSVNDAILEKTKQEIASQYPTQPNIDKKLFHDLVDDFDFEQSMRPFYSTAITTIPNNQAAFANFCYGEMISCKEGDGIACGKTFPRYQQ
jgi:hypothetical protein